jgi:DNA-binding transcriptional regulator YbjK
MSVTLKTLLFVAPFPKDKREELLKVYDQLTEEQIDRLTTAAWLVITEQFNTHLEIEQKKIMMEVEAGTRKFNQSDFEEADAKLMHELSQKFEQAGEKIELDDVREEIAKYQTKPLKQDKTIN